MEWRITITLILVCSLGWLNSQSLRFFDNFLISLITLIGGIIFISRSVVNLTTRKIVLGAILSILFVISIFNTYLLPSEYNVFTSLILDTVTQTETQTKIAYYKELIDEIASSFPNYPLTSFSMLIEIDREINSFSLLSAKLLNYLLHHHINCAFPTTPNSLNDSLFDLVEFFLLIIPSLYLARLAKINGVIKLVFWVLILSSSILAIGGIYFKYLYLNGMIEEGKEILGIWNAPEPRISYSSFTYKNHWSAYAILNLSILFTLLIEVFKENRTAILRSNKLILLSFLAVLHLSSIFYSESNSGIILSLLLIFLITIFIIPVKFTYKISLTCLASILFISLIYVYEHSVLERLINFFSGNSFRLQLWSDLLNQIETKTFWGFGIDSYQTVNGLFQSSAISEARLQNLQGAHQLYIPITVHAHSDILQMLSEFGFIGTCLFIFPIIFTILKNIIFLDSTKYPIISIGLFIFLIYCMVDFPLRNAACLSMFSFVFMHSLVAPKRQIRHLKY